MDNTNGKPKKVFKKYDKEFKIRVVSRYRERSLKESTTYGLKAQVAKEFGICDVTLRDWIKLFDNENATVNGLSDLEKRNIELEKRNSDLERDNAILKEAAVFFARELAPHN